MGTLKIVSDDPDKAVSLKVDALKSIFPLHQGDLFAVGKVRKALEDYGKAYGQYGFIDFAAEPETEIDDEKKVINLTLKFNEEKQYYVRRIEFSGNTTTRDKVIRRELLIDEGQLFNKRAWEVSILRLNQLDYFERIEADKAAEIKRNTKEGTVDINLKLKEKGKQSIGLQGGVSGLAGSLIGLTYQTYNTNSTGFTVFASYPLKRLSFARIGLNYGYSRTNITTFNDASRLLFTATQFRSIAGPSALNGIVSSTITPTISYNSIDSPVNSTKGNSFFYSLAFQCGPLGGNVNTITNVFDIKYF